MYRRDDEKLQCRDGDQADHLSASQGAEPEAFHSARCYMSICHRGVSLFFCVVFLSPPPEGGLNLVTN